MVMIVVLTLGLGLACFSQPCLAAPEAKDSKKLDALKTEILLLQKQLRRADDKHNKLSKELRISELESARLQRELQQLKLEISALNTELNSLEKRQKKLMKKRQRQGQLVSKELDAAYRLGKSEPIKLFLNLEQPDQISRMLKYYQYVVDARKQILADYANTLAEIDTIEASLFDKRNTLESEQIKISESAKKLATQVTERKALLAKIKQRQANDNSRLATLKRERSQLEKIIVKLEQTILQLTIPNETPFAKHKGKLSWPVRGRIRHSFGSIRNTDLRWSGWLLAAKASSPIKAIHHGRVIFSDYFGGHGLLLIIDHGQGYLSLYAHNQILLKDTGDWVASGEKIAQAGDTGGLDRSALYFEIRHRGKAIDPKHWLKPRA